MPEPTSHPTRYRVDYLRAYPQYRREKAEREERELLAERIAKLVVERLRRAS